MEGEGACGWVRAIEGVKRDIDMKTPSTSLRLIRTFWWLAFVVLGVIPQALLAAVIHGRVVGISDGDSITVLDVDRQLHTVRLMGIDAPEKAQPFGQRSKQSLSELIFQKQVTVVSEKKDKYVRTVGRILTAAGCRSFKSRDRPKRYNYILAKLTFKKVETTWLLPLKKSFEVRLLL
jgi:endonuclease YncB( thermonuclease family)